jgi:oligosaccharide repeat unit polymerase
MPWNMLYMLDSFAIGLFAISYYLNCYRKGYRADLWHVTLFFSCVIPYMVMLPFTGNELNALVVGRDFARVVAAIPIVFPITMAGFLAIYVGGSLWSVRAGIGARKTAARVLNIVPRCSLMLLSSRSLLILLSLLCFSSQILMLAVYFANSGFGFDLRSYTFANPGVRPIAQIIALSSVIVASHCLARYVEKKERILLACTLLLTFGLVFFGQRGNLVSIYMSVALCYVVQLRRRISLFRIIISVAALIAFVFYLGSVREGQYSLVEFFSSIAFLALYGNNFCDLRDFAWIYSAWNHEFWLGKTYLAGLATFIPRGASDFRGTWSFGVTTDWIVGLDPLIHPGLKPGTFGEEFFNFGWVGVIGVGLIFGIILRRVDTDVKLALQSPRPSMIKAFASTMLLTISACFVSSLTLPYFYALCGLYLFSWIFLRAQAMIYPRQPSPAAAG